MVEDHRTTNWYASNEELLGFSPKYLDKLEPAEEDVGFGTLLALSLEIEKSVRVVSDRFGGLSHKRIRKECIAAGFDFDSMIEDAIKSGASHQELKEVHKMSGGSIRRIADRIGIVRKPGNRLKKCTYEQIADAYLRNGANASETSRALDVSRTTVMAAIASVSKR